MPVLLSSENACEDGRAQGWKMKTTQEMVESSPPPTRVSYTSLVRDVWVSELFAGVFKPIV